jgi:hypothetical protein
MGATFKESISGFKMAGLTTRGERLKRRILKDSSYSKHHL